MHPGKAIAVILQTPKDEHSAVLIGYWKLANTLASRGHSMTIVTSDDFPVMQRFGGRWTPLTYPVAVAGWVRRHAQGLNLLVFHSYAGWLAAVCGCMRGTPSMVAFHGLEPLYHSELRQEMRSRGRMLSARYRLLQEQLMPAVLRAASRRADRIACLNSAEREYLRIHGWAPPERIVMFAHGVCDLFFAPPRESRAIRQLLFVGQWLHMKGTEYLCEAVARIMDAHDELRLVCAGTLIGEADVLAGFPEQIRSRVSVLPRVEQQALAVLYRESDVFIFPSLYEGFSRALVEAMASRLPIVTTAVGVAIDALEDGKSCLVVPKRNAQAIVAAVERLMGDPSLRLRLSDAAFDVAQKYREADRSREFADILLSVAR